MKFKHIIWDWNGTIVDDTTLSLKVLNTLLAEENLPEASLAYYKDNFGFPVANFYKKLGFEHTQEEFQIIGETFMARYNAARFSCEMQEGVPQLVEAFKKEGGAQSILSAYHKPYLLDAAKHYGLDKIMENIEGLGDINASSKVELGKNLLAKLDCAPSEALVIGDTIHDFEVAEALNCSCALVALGHQSLAQLSKTKAKIFENFHELQENLGII